VSASSTAADAVASRLGVSTPNSRLIELAEALTHAGRIAEGLSVVEAGIVQSEVGGLTPELLRLHGRGDDIPNAEEEYSGTRLSNE
jgi:hypothetical protein